MYFLDFDRTLFDTTAFLSYLGKKLAVPTLEESSYEARVSTMIEAFESGKLSFEPGELSQFLYSDVSEFLRIEGNEAVIVTYGRSDLQKLKIQSAVHGIPRISVLYSEYLPKGEFLAPRYKSYGGIAIFTDDNCEQLDSVSKECEDIKVYEMRRDGMPGDGRWPVVHSLSELP